MTTTTTWREAEAARLRSRAADVAREARQAPPARAKRLRRILLGLLRDAAALAPAPVEIDAATVAQARLAGRCPVQGCAGRPIRGAVLCSACSRSRRYCWRCGRARLRSSFYAGRGSGECADCQQDRDRRPRLAPEARRQVRAAVAASIRPLATAAALERGRASRRPILAAVIAAGGPPGQGGAAGFWRQIGERTGKSAEGARAAWAHAVRRGEVRETASGWTITIGEGTC